MFARLALLASCCLALAASPAPAANSNDSRDGAGFVRCGTTDATRAEADAVQSAVEHYKAVLHGGPRVGTIRVALHIITCDGEGDVPQSQIDAQMRELNAAYRGTGFSFELASVDRTENCRWFSVVTGFGVEKQMKQALAIDPAHRFNVYSCKPGHYLLGWAYFPQAFPEDSYMHGVVMHYGTFPGNYAAPYNQGGTLDHETGHYLGLFHTFQGGCVPPGDYIDDTPFEAIPAFGCPVGRNTCPQPGDDPIHNYMDYSDDACYSEFTFDQADRMQYIVPLYRPSLLDAQLALGGGKAGMTTAPAASVGSGLAFRGASPNPFAKRTTLHFTLAESGVVSLGLYNVAGQRVATLLDGFVAAGEQAVPLDAGAFAPGIYFATLRGAGGTATRTIVLVP